jgi:hypothetical protein
VVQELVALRYKDNKMNQEYSWIIISGTPTNLLRSKKLFERVQSYLAQVLSLRECKTI